MLCNQRFNHSRSSQKRVPGDLEGRGQRDESRAWLRAEKSVVRVGEALLGAAVFLPVVVQKFDGWSERASDTL